MKNKIIFNVLLILVLLLAADWLTKFYFDYNFALGESVSVIGQTFLRWTLVYNYGFSFSIGAAYPLLMRCLVGTFATLVGLVLTLVAIRKLLNKPTKLDRYFAWGQMLIASGAFGNGIERLCFGRVIDFIHFTFAQKYSFAVFNVADIWINIGVYLLLIVMFCQYLKERREQKVSNKKN